MQNINVTTIYIQMFPAVKMLQGVQNIMQIQGDQPADNMKFPDNSRTFPQRFEALLTMLSVTHIMPVLVLLSVVG